MKFKFIKGVKSTIAYTMSRLINLELMEPNLPEKEGSVLVIKPSCIT